MELKKYVRRWFEKSLVWKQGELLKINNRRKNIELEEKDPKLQKEKEKN